MLKKINVSILLTMSLVVGAGAAAARADDMVAPPEPGPCATAQPAVLASAEPLESGSPAPSAEPDGGACAPLSLAPEAAEVSIEAGDLWFDPDEVLIPANGTTTITLIDRGYIAHNVTVDGLGLLLVAPAGRSATVTLTDPPPGTYEFYCSISGHREAGMVGTLVVE